MEFERPLIIIISKEFIVSHLLSLTLQSYLNANLSVFNVIASSLASSILYKQIPHVYIYISRYTRQCSYECLLYAVHVSTLSHCMLEVVYII